MFFDIGTEEVNELLGYMGGLIGDMMPIILIVVGVSLAMFIFNKILK